MATKCEQHPNNQWTVVNTTDPTPVELQQWLSLQNSEFLKSLYAYLIKNGNLTAKQFAKVAGDYSKWASARNIIASKVWTHEWATVSTEYHHYSPELRTSCSTDKLLCVHCGATSERWNNNNYSGD